MQNHIHTVAHDALYNCVKLEACTTPYPELGLVSEWNKTLPISHNMHPSHLALEPRQVFNLSNMQVKYHHVKLNFLFK